MFVKKKKQKKQNTPRYEILQRKIASIYWNYCQEPMHLVLLG